MLCTNKNTALTWAQCPVLSYQEFSRSRTAQYRLAVCSLLGIIASSPLPDIAPNALAAFAYVSSKECRCEDSLGSPPPTDHGPQQLSKVCLAGNAKRGSLACNMRFGGGHSS